MSLRSRLFCAFAALLAFSFILLAFLLQPAELSRAIPLALALSLLLAFVLSTFAIRTFARVTGEIQKVALVMVEDKSARSRLLAMDDVGGLGQTLDHLANDLSRSLHRLTGERDRLEAILETMVDGVLLTNETGEIILANASLRTMCGISGEVIGKQPIETIRSDELAEILESVRISQAPTTGEVGLVGIVARRLRVRAAPLAGQESRGVVAVLSDVTDLRRLETMRSDFVANVSHELRTPIAAIRAAAETLDGGAIHDTDAAGDFVSIIVRHSERLHSLVEDLLALSRIEAQKLELNPVMVSAAEFLRDMVGLYSLSSSRRGIVLTAEQPSSELEVLTDRRALEQIFSNLIDNAIKYAGPRATVTLRGKDSEDAVQLTVHDTGPGISAQHLPRLFERFYRVDRGRSRDVGGTGLGLSIVKHLVEALGGTVMVDSVPGRGSTFTVQLPKVKPKIPTIPPKGPRFSDAELSHEP